MSNNRNRFWAVSDSEDDWSEESSSTESTVEEVPNKMPEKSKYVVISDSDSEEEKRVVRSPKEKYQDELDTVIRSIKNHFKINDWGQLANDFDNLKKQVDDHGSVLSETGYPIPYLREFINLDDAINNLPKATLKGLSKPAAMAYNRLKQMVKKELKNEDFAKHIEDFRANPVEEEVSESESEEYDSSGSESESESESGSESGSESESESASGSESGSESGSGSESESESGYSDYSYSSYDYSESSSDEFGESSSSSSDSEMEVNPKLTGRAKWVLQPKDIEKQKQKEEKRKREEEEKKKREEEKRKQTGEKVDLEEVEEEKTYETPEKLVKAMLSIITTRDEKNPVIVIQNLNALRPFAATLGVTYELRLLSHLASMRFRSAPSNGSLAAEDWQEAFQYVQAILDLLERNPQLRTDFYNMYEAVKNPNQLQIDMKELAESTSVRLENDLPHYLRLLADDYTRAQRAADTHSRGYIERLRDEVKLVLLAEKVEAYYTSQGQIVPSVALIQLQFLHYQRESFYRTFYTTPENPAPSDLFKRVREECGVVYRRGLLTQQMEATLYHVIHLAVNDRFTEARDLMLMSHIQEKISGQGVELWVLFNRAMMQLGLAAFRFGSMSYTHNCLDDLLNLGSRTNQLRALVAQGSESLDEEVHMAQERLSVPMHEWVNMELAEVCYLISCVFSDVVFMVADRNSIYKVSAFFKRTYERYRRQCFIAPETDSTRVFAAYEAILKGDWQAAMQFFRAITVWRLLPAESRDKVLSMIQGKTQVMALQAFLIERSVCYQTLGLSELCDMFSLPANKVRAETNRLLLMGLLNAVWNEDQTAILFVETLPSRVQTLALQIMEKVNELEETNERVKEELKGERKEDRYKLRRTLNVFNQRSGGGKQRQTK